MLVIDGFNTIKRLRVRFCALLFLVLVFSVYAADVDAAGAGVDGAGAVDRFDGMAGAGVGTFERLALVLPAKNC